MTLIYSIFALLNNSLEVLLSSYKKDFTMAGVHPWIPTTFPHLIGHPILLLIIFAFFSVSLPISLEFYISFIIVILLSLIGFYFLLKGYSKSSFSACTAISSINVILVSLGGVFFLGENLDFIQWILIFSGFIGLLIITYPTRCELGKIHFDSGILLVLIGITFLSIGSLFYRYSATLVPDFSTFLGGRLVTDFFIHIIVLLLVLPLITKKSIKLNFIGFLEQKNSKRFLFLTYFRSLASSFLVFVLPASTLGILGTIAIPLSFILGKIKYKEESIYRIYTGTLIIFISIIFFIVRYSY